MSQVRFLLNQFKLPKNGKIYLKKGMFFIIKINKSERDQLVKMGVNLGESGISKTHSRHVVERRKEIIGWHMLQ